MTTSTHQDVRSLSEREIDAATGAASMTAEFHYGDLHVNIYADPSMRLVCTTLGSNSTCRTTL